MIMEDRQTLRTVLIVYGTETGNSQDLANEISRVFERHRFDTNVEEFDNVSPTSFPEYGLVVFVLSTTGQGEFPANARRFWTSLLRKKLTSTYLAGLLYTVVGLGDSSYPKFNWAARKLHKRVQQLGAQCILEPCEADEQGEDSTDGAFIAWIASLKIMLENKYPLPEDQTIVPDGESLPSKWILAVKEDQSHGGSNGVDLKNESKVNGINGISEARLQVTLEENMRTTPASHWQDVRFLRLRSNSNLIYLPGDALAIKPRNMPDDVQTLLDLMQWQHVADQPLTVKSNRKLVLTSRSPRDVLNDGQPFTLRDLLTTSLDINAIPRRSFFGAIAQYTDNDMHKERLLEFVDPQYLDEYYDYATRPRRSILEILQEFDSVQIPWQEAINVFPLLRPRQFSIASGGLLKEGGSVCELLVAIVKYKTVIKRVRQGVCTRYLAQLPVGSVLDVELKTEGRLNTPAQLTHGDHILVGAGTGVAPLRAIAHEKRDRSSTGHTLMIFGCRNQAADFFFRDEWQQLQLATSENQQGSFELITAFSRDQKTKVYIQDRIREHASKIQMLLFQRSATIVVCGSSGAMPKSVRQAFVDILCQEVESKDLGDNMSAEEAEKFLAKLEKEGRYKQETW